MKKKTLAIVIPVGVLLVGAAVWLIISGSVTVAWNGLNGSAGTTNVCKGEIVNTFNDASEYTYRGDDVSVPKVDTEGLKAVMVQVKEMPKYESDPSCQVILFWSAFETKDVETAKTSLAAIKDLHSKRIFPDNNLRTSVPLFDYDTMLEYLVSPPEPATGIVQ